MPIKKSVRLSDTTIKTCHDLTIADGINWSGSINAMAEQYQIFLTDCLPELSDYEKKAFYCVYNGYLPHPDINEEMHGLHWAISEGYHYDEQVRDFLGTEEQAGLFVERIKNWSRSEKLAVIYMAKAYWRQGPICEN